MRYHSAGLFLLSSHAVSGCPFLQLRENAKQRRAERPANHPVLRKASSAQTNERSDEDIDDATGLAPRQLQTCAANERAKECGASGRNRPESCCAGYECSGMRCVEAQWVWPTEYRTLDGTNNNLANPSWGAVNSTLLRRVPAQYVDGASKPVDEDEGLPNPRAVSNAIAEQTSTSVNSAGANDLFWQWGQFLDHDLSFTESSGTEDFHIDIPQGDPQLDPNSTGAVQIDFTRSLFMDDASNVRQQLNSITSYIDASLIYGENEERASALKAVRFNQTGRLASQTLDRTFDNVTERFLPFNVDGQPNKGGTNATDLFLAGDFRANEHVGLVSFHTLFLREHNYWANTINAKYSSISQDDVYERARIMVACEIQSITYNEFLPVLLGTDWNASNPYTGYDSSVNAGISNVFAAAAFRVGHTMVSDKIVCLDESDNEIVDCTVNISDAFFGTDDILAYGIDPYLRGMSQQKCQEIDTEVVDSLRNFLFSDPGSPVAGGFDLVALNIQRGRDHGLGSYNDVRETFGLARIESFDDFQGIGTISNTLATLYGNITHLDAWVGMLAEEHVQGAMVGETLKAVLVDQFVRLRDGDRFWYQTLNETLISECEKHSLNDIVVRNTDITGGITFTA